MTTGFAEPQRQRERVTSLGRLRRRTATAVTGRYTPPSMQSAAIGLNKTECEIGRDGVGEVYIARDARPDRQLAIKASAEHLAQDPDRLARFQRETKVVTTLSHPSIDAIHGLELANGQPRALPAVSLSESTPEHEWVRST